MKAASAILLLLLSACAEGEMTGVSFTPQGTPLGRAEFTYRETGIGSGTVTVRMPGGEFFEGTYVTATTTETGYGRVSSRYNSASVFATSSVSSNQYEAVLFSSLNNSMRCRFRGDSLRGVGACEVSDGRKVDVQW